MDTPWQIAGCSVRGASHDRTGLPNQDAIGWRPGRWPILSIADGHGSAQHFRSQTGSRLAVEAMLSVLCAFIEGLDPAQPIEKLELAVEDELRSQLVTTWRQSVRAHLQEQPESEAEWSQLTSELGFSGRLLQQKVPELAYGSTVLGVLGSAHFLLFVQLGDGDILCVSDTGSVSRPFERDRRFAINQTTSLCLEEAALETRIRLWGAPLPALVLLSTDGYANSYASEDEFAEIGPQYLQFIRAHGLDRLEIELPAVLQEVSRRGSGDDITLGVLLRGPSSPTPE
ncbi:PP2C family serine/threonine-protein phosphatase [Gloeobacter kilaueensis]|uniref:PPM-type phosphatase domain-containing protein n=1 Tax=Gloeobacter kilaueensis (strain ATCC BAA-2537 / CCAP 1431/1 / ULC 316 / JS1) TaxID=1183438 RepID=U5QGQ7_GLOK1|nr:PP2C family serine/threonine-protein phosphatase [Gloeobacter kilaueensis]AGY58162.1 hypothetical protein GKIL_1916 [Gloeobacter kilaueensis JS1]